MNKTVTLTPANEEKRMGKREHETGNGTATVAQLKIDQAGVVAVKVEGREGWQEGFVMDLWAVCVQLRLAHLGLGVLFFSVTVQSCLTRGNGRIQCKVGSMLMRAE